jgi:hypothetical protein
MKDQHNDSTLDLFQIHNPMINAITAQQQFVLVSFVAKAWNVTPRRIRALLSAGRLAGRVQDNGYWEVLYPYAVKIGTRGPALQHQQKSERRAA